MLRQRTLWLFIALFILSGSLASGAAWYVDRNASGPVYDGMTMKTAFLTIQEGVTAASDGDEVLVNSGVYFGKGNTNISFAGKKITVASLKGPHVTLIDCMGAAPAFVFNSGEDNDSVLHGFTLFQAGLADGAVTVSKCSPVVSGNIIRSAAGTTGGGIHCYGGSPIITRNVIFDCSGDEAGGIYLQYVTSGVLTSNIVFNCSSDLGGGVAVIDSDITATNNTFAANEALVGGGGIYCYQSSVKVFNSIFWNNSAPRGAAAYLEGATGSDMDVGYTDVEGGQGSIAVDSGSTLTWGTGNIDADPLFVDAADGDYHIFFDSPCRSAGWRDAPQMPDLDFEGDHRTGLFAFPDMGGDEFDTHFYVQGRPSAGATVVAKIVGWPLTNPVVLISGTSLRWTPMPTPYGDLWLHAPWEHRVHFNELPNTGVRFIKRTMMTTALPGTEIPLQAVIGTELSNVWVILIEP